MKIIGLFCVGLFVLFSSLGYQREVLRREKETEGFLLLLRHIRSRILCFREPISDIIHSFENKYLQKYGFLDMAKTNTPAKAFAVYRQGSLLSQQTKENLTCFFEGLGKSYAAGEVSHCDYYIALLEKELEYLRQESPKKIKLCRSLLYTGGLVTVILFL